MQGAGRDSDDGTGWSGGAVVGGVAPAHGALPVVGRAAVHGAGSDGDEGGGRRGVRHLGVRDGVAVGIRGGVVFGGDVGGSVGRGVAVGVGGGVIEAHKAAVTGRGVRGHGRVEVGDAAVERKRRRVGEGRVVGAGGVRPDVGVVGVGWRGVWCSVGVAAVEIARVWATRVAATRVWATRVGATRVGAARVAQIAVWTCRVCQVRVAQPGVEGRGVREARVDRPRVGPRGVRCRAVGGPRVRQGRVAASVAPHHGEVGLGGARVGPQPRVGRGREVRQAAGQQRGRGDHHQGRAAPPREGVEEPCRHPHLGRSGSRILGAPGLWIHPERGRPQFTAQRHEKSRRGSS